VKFIFPNSHFVFLHDTPSKALFERAERTFSSGCIRVENPFVLAELMLNNPAKWNAESIQVLLDSEKPQTVFLDEPLTVMLLYGTVGVTDMERVRFYNDIYQRDARVLNSLNADFEFRL
jgi:murein L,D-transpeptidase YcbB/YkuD